MSLRAAFSEEEWTVLSTQLRLKPQTINDQQPYFSARTLLNDEVCAHMLDQLGPVIGSPTRAITASLLGKRLSFLATGACLYAMSVCEQGLLLNLDDCRVETGHDGRMWTSAMPLPDQAPLVYAPGERDAWRESLVSALFADVLAPLWETFNRVSGISRRILWENTAVRVYSLYERRMAKIDDAVIRQRYMADFDWLLNKAEPEMFGLKYNPLSHFRRPPTVLAEGKSIRFRRTCCFYYEASNPVEYCSTCPLLRPRKAR